MPTPSSQWIPFDTCWIAFFELECDGTVSIDNPDPLLFCGFNNLVYRDLVRTIDAIQVPGLRSDEFCAGRKARTVSDGCEVDFVGCGIVAPDLFEMFSYADKWIDTAGNEVGYQARSEDDSCTTCRKSAGGCPKRVAAVHVQPTTCDGEKAHPDHEFQARISPMLEFRPVENSQNVGPGFPEGLTFTATALENPNFLDPWGLIDAAQPLTRKWGVRTFVCPEGSAIEAAVEQACNCLSCT